MQPTVANIKQSMKITSDKLLVQDLEVKTSKQGNQFMTGYLCEVMYSKKQSKEFVTNYMNFVCFEPNVYAPLQIGSTFQLLDGDFRIENYKDRSDNWKSTNKLILNNIAVNGNNFELLSDKAKAKLNAGQQQYAQPAPPQPQYQQQPQYAQPAPPQQQPSPYPQQDMTQQYPGAYPAGPQGQQGPQSAPAQPQNVGSLPQAPTMGNY